MQKKLLSQLKANQDFLSNTEKKIAAVILENPRRFLGYSMAELAKTAEVSQGSINNFARKFAEGGYPELKLQIAGNLSAYEQQPFSVIGKGDTVMDALNKTIHENQTAFRHTAELNDEATLRRVAERILKAKKVEIYGIFRSAVIATDFYYQLLQLGIPAAFVSDVLSCAISASMLSHDSLAIAISSSGETKDIIDVVKTAKARQVPVVCLTSNKRSPLAKLSDDVLVTAASGSSVSGQATEIRSSALLVIDALCSYLQSRIDEDGERSYFGLEEILNSHSVKD